MFPIIFGFVPIVEIFPGYLVIVVPDDHSSGVDAPNGSSPNPIIR